MSAVREAIKSAIASAEAELAGLSRRLEDVRLTAASLVGNEAEEASERDEEKSDELSRAETDLMAAESRAADLRLHITMLQDLAQVAASTLDGRER